MTRRIMKTVKDEKVWGYSQKCLPETDRQNNFIHSGVKKKKKKKDSSNPRKEEGKKERGMWQEWEGLSAKCIWAVGPRVCFPVGAWGSYSKASRDGVTGENQTSWGLRGPPPCPKHRQVKKLKVASGWKGTRH